MYPTQRVTLSSSPVLVPRTCCCGGLVSRAYDQSLEFHASEPRQVSSDSGLLGSFLRLCGTFRTQPSFTSKRPTVSAFANTARRSAASLTLTPNWDSSTCFANSSRLAHSPPRKAMPLFQQPVLNMYPTQRVTLSSSRWAVARLLGGLASGEYDHSLEFQASECRQELPGCGRATSLHGSELR